MKASSKNTLKRVLLFVGTVAVIAAFLLGMLMFLLGSAERSKIKKAAQQYTAVQVRVTEARFSDSGKNLLAVVLEPVSREQESRRLGRTVATTGNRALQTGDELTMYYDPRNTDTRIVDFNTWKPMFCIGGILSAVSGGMLLLLLGIHIIRKKRSRRPAAQIRTE